MQTWVERTRSDRQSIEDGVVYAVDGSSGATYTVRQLPDGSWACDCPDFTYRSPGVPRYECKHIPRARAKLAADVQLVGNLL